MAVNLDQSGRRELNPGPLAPHASALAGLRHAPIRTICLAKKYYIFISPIWQTIQTCGYGKTISRTPRNS